MKVNTILKNFSVAVSVFKIAASVVEHGCARIGSKCDASSKNSCCESESSCVSAEGQNYGFCTNKKIDNCLKIGQFCGFEAAQRCCEGTHCNGFDFLCALGSLEESFGGFEEEREMQENTFPPNLTSNFETPLPTIISSTAPTSENDTNVDSTLFPTLGPTSSPTQGPRIAPTFKPTFTPTVEPTSVATLRPTFVPTSKPTEAATLRPTFMPTQGPTSLPTQVPILEPTMGPTFAPTLKATIAPTVKPTSTPTLGPTEAPTFGPTMLPTEGPTEVLTQRPTEAPTLVPTLLPTQGPTEAPTLGPTLLPTQRPTEAPTQVPTSLPTQGPTEAPIFETPSGSTFAPTLSPSTAPTIGPTVAPTLGPTLTPTIGPTTVPTQKPTSAPTIGPTMISTLEPTIAPTLGPTTAPTQKPTSVPTLGPSLAPTIGPTIAPTIGPTLTPTQKPTTSPTVAITLEPTQAPSLNPTIKPTQNPTIVPTTNPTPAPTMKATINPTSSPTMAITLEPTQIPTTLGSTSEPTLAPTSVSTFAPSFAPTSTPIYEANPITISPETSVAPTLVPSPSLILEPTSMPTLSGINIIRMTSVLSNQDPNEVSAEIWEETVKLTLNSTISSDLYSVKCESVSSGSERKMLRSRMLQTSNDTIIITTLSGMEAAYVQPIKEYLETIKGDLILNYDLLAASSNSLELTATEVSLSFEDVSLSETESNGSDSGLSEGAIAGIIFAIVFAIVCAVVFAWLCTKKYKAENGARFVDEFPISELEAEEQTQEEGNRLEDNSQQNTQFSRAISLASPENETQQRNDAEIHVGAALRGVGLVTIGLAQVGYSIPIVGSMLVVCGQIAILFEAYQDMEVNCKEVVRWCRAMEDILKNLESQVREFPRLIKKINMGSLMMCSEKLRELLDIANVHKSTNFLTKFALSQKNKTLMEEAAESFHIAVSTLQLSLATASLAVNMKIDHNIDLILTAVDGMQVKLTKVLEEVAKKNSERNYEASISANKSQSAETDEEYPSSSFSKEIESTFVTEDGRKMGSTLIQEMSSEIRRMEIAQEEIKRVQQTPIGSGGFAKVYKVEYKGEICAAKVIQLSGTPMKQLQKIYLKFSKELYILSKIQSPRIVTLYGSSCTLNEVTLVLEYMQRGCLRTLLREGSDWTELEPFQRHQILKDTVEGMEYLHSHKIYHRDLKSANILITDDFRAKLTDFGLSKTTDAVTMSSQSNFAGGTIAWIPPEAFDKTPSDWTKFDAYSYGIVTWEVLMGLESGGESKPWAGMTDAQIIRAVMVGKRPELPEHCVWEGNVVRADVHRDVMIRCLEGNPDNRPSFDEIAKLLD